VVAKTKNKGKGKRRKTPVLRPVVETPAVGGDEDIPPLSLSQTGSAGETYEEEEVVDQLLSEAPIPPEDRMQIMTALENPGQVGDIVLDGEDDDGDDDDEDDELERLLKARGAKVKATSQSKPYAATASRPQTNANPLARSPTHNALANISTPVPAHRRRSARAAAVTSVVESNFPSPGTRARAFREHKEREAKMAPYEPPEGTRASAHRARLFR
jgi:hypothetical protein